MKPSKENILNFIELNKTMLSNTFSLKKIGLFGSYARAENTTDSDIDIVIEFKENTNDIFIKKSKLRELFFNEFEKEIDICNLKYIKPHYEPYIMNDVLFV